jgi:hypothetical protein
VLNDLHDLGVVVTGCPYLAHVVVTNVPTLAGDLRREHDRSIGFRNIWPPTTIGVYLGLF